MFCPSCGQERNSPDTNFCSRCGFLLTGTMELLQKGGVANTPAQTPNKGQSPRARGVKKGLFIFLLTFLVVPIIAILSIAANVREPIVVAIATILLFVGGLLRMAYALMFEDAAPQTASGSDDFLAAAQTHMNRAATQSALPPQRSMPASAYAAPTAGQWRDTNDLQPTSVVEGTTKLLDTEEKA